MPEPFLIDLTLLRDRVPSFDEYPFAIPAIRSLDRIDFHPAVTFFVGENGTGKSTLLEALALAEGFNAEGAVETSISPRGLRTRRCMSAFA